MNDTTWFWQIVDARGLADVSSDEFVALNELISKAERAEMELDTVSAAIGSVRFMDPPDGGDVSLAEQVRRMREALTTAETERNELLREKERMGAGWRDLPTVPEDEMVIVATTGGWVGEATVIDGEWRWAAGNVFHSNIVPLKWMPLPDHPSALENVPAGLADAASKSPAPSHISNISVEISHED